MSIINLSQNLPPLGTVMDHIEIKKYCKDRITEIKSVAQNGNQTGFICIAAFVDFLAKISEGEDKGREGYKRLIREYFDPRYKQFTYSSGDADLPDQFYHIFRCGILHSFSLYPDRNNRRSSKVRTIVISHTGIDSDGDSFAHLQGYTKSGLDAAVLIANDLCDDISSAIDKMFASTSIQSNSEKWVLCQPPIKGL